MTPVTISSFDPLVSILTCPTSRGDGGGVVSASRLALGRLSFLIFGESFFEALVGDVALEAAEFSCFSFLGGWSSSEGVMVMLVVTGGEPCEADLELFGMWMPSSDEIDLLLVL